MNNYTTFVSILVEILKKQQHFSGHDYLMAAKSFVAQWYPSALFYEKNYGSNLKSHIVVTIKLSTTKKD